MELSHVRSVAKSVTRYRARWIAAGAYYTQEQQTLWGRERGLRSGAARRKRTAARDAAIIQLRAEGLKQAEIAVRVDASQQVVSYVLRRNTNELHR